MPSNETVAETLLDMILKEKILIPGPEGVPCNAEEKIQKFLDNYGMSVHKQAQLGLLSAVTGVLEDFKMEISNERKS